MIFIEFETVYYKHLFPSFIHSFMEIILNDGVEFKELI